MLPKGGKSIEMVMGILLCCVCIQRGGTYRGRDNSHTIWGSGVDIVGGGGCPPPPQAPPPPPDDDYDYDLPV